MFGVFFMKSRGVDEKVFHINDEPSLCNHITERVIHEPLEGSWGVGEFEEHDSGFE